MNRNVILTVLILSCLILMPAVISHAYMYDDPVNEVWHKPGLPDDYDRIGISLFELYGVDINIGPSTTQIDIYTNYPLSGYSAGIWDTFPADFAFDIDLDGVYEHGLAFTGHGGIVQGSLYDNVLWDTSTDHDPYNTPYPETGCVYVYHAGKIVTIASGSVAGSGSQVTWNVYDTQGDDSVPDWRIEAIFDNSQLWGAETPGSFNFFFGGATCANDFIGHEVPEPASMLLFGAGALGFGFLKRRKK